jgi:hypothetical protein
MGKQVSSLQRSVQDLWSAQRAGGTRVNVLNPVANNAPAETNNQNGSVGQGENTPVQDNRPCPACDEMGHMPRDCRNRKNQYFTCCRYWQMHRFECPQFGNPLPVQNNNPPVQNHYYLEGMFTEEECFYNEQEMQEFYAAEEDIDLECPKTSDSEWYSTDEEDEEEEDEEIYAGKRTIFCDCDGGRGSKKETRTPKAQRRETNELPPKKRDAKPVLRPLTEEEKRKRAETRKHN